MDGDKEIVLALISIVSVVVSGVLGAMTTAQKTIIKTLTTQITEAAAREERRIAECNAAREARIKECNDEKHKLTDDNRENTAVIQRAEQTFARMVDANERITRLIEDLVYGRPDPGSQARRRS